MATIASSNLFSIIVYYCPLPFLSVFVFVPFLFFFSFRFQQFFGYLSPHLHKVLDLEWKCPNLTSFLYFNSIQFHSVTQLCPTLCDPMNHSTPGLPVHHRLPEFTETHVHRVSDAIQPSHPLSSPSPPAPNPSQHQSLSNESTLRMRWPKYWSFSFSIIPSKEILGLISFRMDWWWLKDKEGESPWK